MTLPLIMAGRPVRYILTTLCNHGEHGDFQAFPAVRLELDVLDLGRRLAHSGAERVRAGGGRLAFDWRGAAVTVFAGGRILLEGVRPDRQAAAAEAISGFLACAAPDAVAQA